MVRHVVTSFVFLVLIGVALFVPAGTLRWPMAWATLAVYAGLAVAAVVLLDPEMLRQREAVERAGAVWDPPIAIGGLVFMIILPMLISGLDVRRHGGSSPLVPSVRFAAFVLFAAGQVFGLWAMRANRFFAKFVRIQHERGHRVVTDGPYAFVRHPGYAGGIVSYVALPVALGSPRAALIACIGGMFFVRAHVARGSDVTRRPAGVSRLRGARPVAPAAGRLVRTVTGSHGSYARMVRTALPRDRGQRWRGNHARRRLADGRRVSEPTATGIAPGRASRCTVGRAAAAVGRRGGTTRRAAGRGSTTSR